MGNKIIKITNSQLKMLVENTVLDQKLQINEAEGEDFPPKIVEVGNNIYNAAIHEGTNPKAISDAFKKISNQTELNSLDKYIASKYRIGFKYKSFIDVCNGEFDNYDYDKMGIIMHHAFLNKIKITATPRKLYGNSGPKSWNDKFVPSAGTWKVGEPFSIYKGPTGGEVTQTDDKTNSADNTKKQPTEDVKKIQTDLKAKGYKLQYAGRNGGIDGIKGYWTRRAMEYDNKKIGPEKFNKELIAAWNAKRQKKAPTPTATAKASDETSYGEVDDIPSK